MKKLIGSLIALPLLTAGVVVGASSAQAANILPPVVTPGFSNIYAISSPAGGNNGVTVNISGGNVTFSFQPSPPSNYNVTLATGAFTQFGGLPGSIKNVTVPLAGGPASITSFLNLDNVGGDSSFDLATVAPPVFSVVPGLGTIVNIGVLGKFNQGSTAYNGSGLFSATFVGQTPAQILAQAATPRGIRTSWSATFTLVQSVPEPSNVAGLIVFAGVSTVLLKRRQKKLS